MVYQREPHARQLAFGDIGQPESFEERAALARRMLQELELDVEVWIDDLGDSSRATFGDLPSWAVMLSTGGTIMRKIAWPDPESLTAITGDLPNRAAAGPPTADRVRANRQKYSLKQAKELLTSHLYLTEEARAARRHDRHAHLAYLIESAPEHASRSEWLQELAESGPPYQRAWARQRQLADKAHEDR